MAETASAVMGNCTYASPAKTISPILSSDIWSINFDSISLARSKRLGCTSCANIELETSSTIIASTPWCLVVCNFEPNCGRANATIISVSATNSI